MSKPDPASYQSGGRGLGHYGAGRYGAWTLRRCFQEVGRYGAVFAGYVDEKIVLYFE